MAQVGPVPRQRMFNALQGTNSDGLAAAPAYPSLFLADFERSYYIEQYRRRMKGYSHHPVNHREDTLFRAQAIYQSYGIFKVKPDWIEVHQGASRAWAERTEIVAQDNVLYYQDRESGRRVPMHQAAMPRGDARLAAASASLTDLWDTSGQIRDKEEVDALLPILSTDALLARGDLDLPKQIVADYGDEYFISTILDTPFSDAYDLLGFQGLMLIQHDRPALFHHLLQRKLAQTQEVMGAWAATGIHGIYVEEVFTGADLISPKSYDEYVFTYNQPYFQHMRSLGLLPIHYVCGDVIPRLDRILELDIAAVAVEESKKNFCIEIEDVVQKVDGRATVFGNIDAVRFGLQASLDEMAAEVKRQARIGARARGFVISTGSPFPLDTNPRLLDTLVATAHSVKLTTDYRRGLARHLKGGETGLFLVIESNAAIDRAICDGGKETEGGRNDVVQEMDLCPIGVHCDHSRTGWVWRHTCANRGLQPADPGSRPTDPGPC
jgi:uroporphyrinogen-III decarboxylase